MNLENVKYDAFISYRHCELDKFVAENLHKQLEAFKVPKALSASNKTNGKTKIERVFRDRDELPLASNLADPITQALEHSDYLIVICSPRLPESKWCLKEIETFIGMHGRDHILAVLIEGEPVDSFPDILRFEEREITDKNGNTHIEKIEVEPLAADVRGRNKKEVLKQIKNELLRLVAPILDCNYDDLKMRHKEARQKKILRISLGISSICLVFAAVSTTMALTIHKQAGTIKKQYHEALETQAISYASTSGRLLAEEDRLAAVALARMALPDRISDQTDKPYTAEAEYALTNSLGVYSTGRFNQAVSTLEQNSPIQFMLVAPDAKTITTVDTHSQITIYDVDTATTLYTFAVPADESYNITKGKIDYLDNTHIAFLTDDGYCIYDISSGNTSDITLDTKYNHLKCSGDGSYIGLSGWKNISIITSSGEEIFHYNIPKDMSGDTTMCFNKENNLFAFSASIPNTQPEGKNNGIVGLVNIESKKLLQTFDVASPVANQLSFYNDQLIYCGSSYIKGENYADYQANSDIYSFSLTENKVNWTYHKDNANYQHFIGSSKWDTPWIILSGFSKIEYLNGKNGSTFASFDTDSKILSTAPLETTGAILAFTENGERLLATADPDFEPVTIEAYDITNGEFSDYSFERNIEAACRRKGTSVTIYKRLTGPQTEVVCSLDNFLVNSVYSTNKHTLAGYDVNDQIFLYNTDTAKTISLEYNGENIRGIFFTENGQTLAVLDKQNIFLYHVSDGSIIKTLSLTNDWKALTGNESVSAEFLNATDDGNAVLYFDAITSAFYSYFIKEEKLTLTHALDNTDDTIPIASASENHEYLAVLSQDSDTLSIINTSTGKTDNTMKVNASLVTQIICSKYADCLMIMYLDETVNVYRLSDLRLIDTYTNLEGTLNSFQRIDMETSSSDSKAPAYVLCGTSHSYLLNADFQMLAHCSQYLGFDNGTLYFGSGTDIVKSPYYNYDMLIKEADNQLANYKMSERKKNQLGIE